MIKIVFISKIICNFVKFQIKKVWVKVRYFWLHNLNIYFPFSFDKDSYDNKANFQLGMCQLVCPFEFTFCKQLFERNQE